MTSTLSLLLRQAGGSALGTLVLGSVALAAVAGAPVASAATLDLAADPSVQSATIDNFAFAPAELTVPVGTSLTWTNLQTDVPHTATSVDGVWDSGTLAGGAAFTTSFAQAGDFAYECLIHPSMRGIVHVVAPAPEPAAQVPTPASAPATAVNYGY